MLPDHQNAFHWVQMRLILFQNWSPVFARLLLSYKDEHRCALIAMYCTWNHPASFYILSCIVCYKKRLGATFVPLLLVGITGLHLPGDQTPNSHFGLKQTVQFFIKKKNPILFQKTILT